MFRIPEVVIDDIDGKQKEGDLTVHHLFNEIVFLFEAKTVDDLIIYFRLSELSGIVLDKLIVRFILDSSLQIFYLTKQNLIFFVHLLEFLKNKNYIVDNGQDQWYVQIPFTPCNSILEYIAPSRKTSKKIYFSPFNYTIYLEHSKIINSFYTDIIQNKNNLTLKECLSYFKDGKCENFDELETIVFEHGLDNESRAYLYPYLLGVKDPKKSKEENDKIFKEQTRHYKIIKEQWKSFLPSQISEIRQVSELIRVVDNDVKRTDRFLPQFKDEKSPFCLLLNNILVTYGVYNGNSNYVQGMGDLISPIIVLIIKSWTQDDKAILYNDEILERDEIESLLFWILVGILKTLVHGRLFNNLFDNQKFILEKIYNIASRIDPPFKKWAEFSSNTNIIFMFRPYLLLFKRDFLIPNLLRVWDCFFSSKYKSAFPRIFTTSILLLLFPKYLSSLDETLGEIVQITDTSIIQIDPIIALNLAYKIQEKILKFNNSQWLFEEIPESEEFIELKPKFLLLK